MLGPKLNIYTIANKNKKFDFKVFSDIYTFIELLITKPPPQLHVPPRPPPLPTGLKDCLLSTSASLEHRLFKRNRIYTKIRYQKLIIPN